MTWPHEHMCGTLRTYIREPGTAQTAPALRKTSVGGPPVADDSRPVWQAPHPVAVLLPADVPTLPPTVRYGLPASWEDCVALGLDPLGGE